MQNVRKSVKPQIKLGSQKSSLDDMLNAPSKNSCKAGLPAVYAMSYVKPVLSRLQCYLPDSLLIRGILQPPPNIGKRPLQSTRASALPESDVVAHKAPLALQLSPRSTSLRGASSDLSKRPIPKYHLSDLSHWVLCAGLSGQAQHLKILDSTKLSRAMQQRQQKAIVRGLDVFHQ